MRGMLRNLSLLFAAAPLFAAEGWVELFNGKDLTGWRAPMGTWSAVGGVVLGAYADRAGRKAAMSLTLWLMTLGSALIAFAPTYAAIGLAAPLLVILARLIQGFALGGEIGASTSLLLEYGSDNMRGFYGSWQFVSQGLNTVCG